MSGFNKTILLGNLTRDPELKYAPNGTAAAKLGMAVNRTWRGKDGEKQEDVTFIDIDAFGKQAETIAKYCTKGASLLVEGRLKLDQWEDRQSGQKRSKLGVVLESFTFTGGSAKQAANSTTPAEPGPGPDRNSGEDDVPF